MTSRQSPSQPVGSSATENRLLCCSSLSRRQQSSSIHLQEHRTSKVQSARKSSCANQPRIRLTHKALAQTKDNVTLI
ncbi:MAG: hypothetical protein FRX48_05895 [Lasallia pustulata]|uniref:Uncharacterized protein n=1 Tax=Lasallia pustulata TaxID=136370 RepID=A0A5M8PNB5_9LECA|nr:MAG: hypothetical protein FRX48_05895 [Lasallia pustulata]